MSPGRAEHKIDHPAYEGCPDGFVDKSEVRDPLRACRLRQGLHDNRKAVKMLVYIHMKKGKAGLLEAFDLSVNLPFDISGPYLSQHQSLQQGLLAEKAPVRADQRWDFRRW
jgi:hypothetical protein